MCLLLYQAPGAAAATPAVSQPQQRPDAHDPGLVYADLSFQPPKPGTAPPPTVVIHGQGEGVEYACVDFKKTGGAQTAAPDSASDDDEYIPRQ